MEMHRSPSLFGRLALTLLLLVSLCAVAEAQTLSLKAPVIDNVNGALKARFGVTVVEKPVFKGELKDGTEMVLKCAVELFERNDFWLDSTLSGTTFESVIRYDRLTQEFVLTLPGKKKPLRDKALAPLLEKGWGSIETTLGPWNMLERGTNYSLRLITTLNEKDAPEGFTKYLYFWSWDAGADNTFHLNFSF